MSAYIDRLDVGSQSIKGVLLDPAGQVVVAVGRQCCAMRHPRERLGRAGPAELAAGLGHGRAPRC